MIQDMINSETIWIQLNRQTQTYSSCLMLQFKGKNTLKLPFDSNFNKKLCAWSINMSNMSNQLVNLRCF